MPDDDVVAVTAGFIAYDANLAGESRADRVTDIYFNVQSLVLATPSRAKIARYHAAWCGHAEVPEVDLKRVGKLSSAVRISVIPLVTIKLCGR